MASPSKPRPSLTFSTIRSWCTRQRGQRAEGEQISWIRAGTDFLGSVSVVAGSAVLVEGTLLGDILNAGTVYVAETGRVRGMIQAEEVVVAGEIHGDVHARARCEVHPTGLIVGSVRSNACLFREGARVAGVFRVGQVEALLPAASAPTAGASASPETPAVGPTARAYRVTLTP